MNTSSASCRAWLSLCFGLTASLTAAEPVATASATRSFPNLFPGKLIHISKYTDPVTGKFGLTSDDPAIQSASDLARIETEEWNKVRAKVGALESGLVTKLSKLSPDEKIRVIVSLRSPMGIRYLDKFRHSLDELIADSRRVELIKPEKSMDAVLGSHSIGKGTSTTPHFRVQTLPTRPCEHLMSRFQTPSHRENTFVLS